MSSTKLRKYMCPSWDGDMLICENNIFSKISCLFQKQTSQYGRRIGALHIKFSEGISDALCHESFTACTEKKVYDWKSSRKHSGLYYDTNVNGIKLKNIPVRNILEEDKCYTRVFNEDSTISDLEQYIRCCERRHAYGYGFLPDVETKFEQIGSLNMFKMKDFLCSSEDLLKKYHKMEGIVTPWGLAAPAGTITPIHLEDHKFLSINQLVTKRKTEAIHKKGWIVADSDPENVHNLLTAMSTEVVSCRIPGCSEQGQKPCPCFHVQKSFFFSPEWLIRHNIRFVIILQSPGDIIITETHAFHEIVNFAPNVTVARNLCTNMSFSAFTPDYVRCSHRKRHISLRLGLSQMGHAKWVSEMQNDTVTLRSSVFMVSNVKWPRNIRRDRQHTHKNNVFKVNQSLQAKLGLTYGSKNGKNWKNVHGNRRLIRSIHVNSDRNRSNQVFVTLRNPNCLQTDQILSALVEVFEPFVKSNPIQAVPIIDRAAIKLVGNHRLSEGGYVDLPYSLVEQRRSALKRLQVLHFTERPSIMIKRAPPHEDLEQLCPPYKKPKTLPRCLLCKKGETVETPEHLEGSTHAKHLDLLMRLWLLKNTDLGLQCDRMNTCRKCKGTNLRTKHDRNNHMNSKGHMEKEALEKRWENEKVTPEMYGLDVSSSKNSLSSYINGIILHI